MKDAEIIERMREVAIALPASAVASAFEDIANQALTYGMFVTFFKRAFPDIPLHVILEAGQWKRFNQSGELGDADIDAIFARWLPMGAVPFDK